MTLNQNLPSHLGEVPNDWKRVILSDVMKVRQGLQISISERLKKPTKTSQEYITIQSIKKTDQAREYVEAPSKRVICGKEDVLMTRTGNTGIVVTDVEGVFHNNFFLMDFDRNQIDKKFLVNYLRTTRVQHLILTKAGASTIPDLNHKDFYSIEFPLASLPEQRKIAKILSTWDKAISTTERLIDNSKQQKTSLMQQLLTGNERLHDDSGKPFEGEWEDKKLHDVAQIIVSPVDKKTVEGEIPVELCNYTDVYYNIRITKSLSFMKATAKQSEIDKFTLKVDDVIITKDSETPGDIAIPALVSEDLDGVVCGYHLAIIRPNNELVEGAFINYLFSMHKTRYYFFTLATGATRFGLSVGGINKAHFTLPPLVEQQKIAAVLANADKEIELLERQLADLKQEKKALMQQLLTGKRRVKIESQE
ncbi:MAG: restriction endonuclease subunit S [Colwellia sp.]